MVRFEINTSWNFHGYENEKHRTEFNILVPKLLSSGNLLIFFNSNTDRGPRQNYTFFKGVIINQRQTIQTCSMTY